MKKIISALILLALLIPTVCVCAQAETALIPGGQVIGLALAEGSLTVISIDEDLGQAVKEAGLQTGDKLTQINNTAVRSIDQVRTALQKNTDAVDLQILRSGKTKHLQVTPAHTEEGPRLGIYLKEGITGIGTVTYYDPQSGTYGALGHGVNQSDGTLAAMENGSTYRAAILAVQKGECGKPGQLMGTLADQMPTGTIVKNTPHGIFGQLSPANSPALPLGQAREGDAVIRSTVDEKGVQEYSVEILRIYPSSRNDGRNMLLRVTDPKLLDATGGIVQGMSGSPIIQDGKLIGAVTHVLVNDPTTGYGIFIENMLDAAA